MGKEHLANLALLHIHYEQQINVESVIDMFVSFHPRRMEMESLMESQYVLKNVFNHLTQQ